MDRKYRALCASGLAITASLAAAEAALAQSAPEAAGEPVGLEEVVVTAQHRSENVQTTALSVSALGGDELAARHIDNVQGLSAAIPNVNFGTYNGSARVSIRGIGDDAISPGAEARTAFHVDSVYLSRPQASMAGFYDIDRVEVVRGPQGTLYGRNATAGAINVLTKNPTDTFEGYAKATLGNYELYKGEAAVGGPLGGGFSGRLAAQITSRGGYGHNITAGGDVDDEETRGVRAKLRYELSPDVDLVLSADHFHQDDHNGGWHYLGPGSPGLTPFANQLGGAIPLDRYDVSGNVPSRTKRETGGVSAAVNADLGGANFTSISAYRELESRTLTDYDMTNLNLALYDIREKADQFSQEFRLQSDYARGHWLVGAYYFKESGHGSLAIPLDQRLYFGPPGYVQGYYIEGDLDTEAYAVFGQADFAINDSLSLVLGGRYSSERKSIDEGLAFDTLTPFNGVVAPGPLFTNEDSKRWSDFTVRASVEYKPTSNIFIYATYAEGFKSGGFNLGGLQPAFNPEGLKDYEAGIKAEWFDRRLRTNISVFKYDYSDLQVTKVVDASLRVENAARAKLYGAEFEIVARPIAGLELGANVSLLHSKYTRFETQDPARAALGLLDLAGNELNQAPSYSVSLSAEYTAPVASGELTLRGEGHFVDDVYFTPFNLSYVGQPSYEKFNLFATYEPSEGNWTLQLFARNIGEKITRASAVVGSGLAGFPISGSYAPPRTYGVEIGYRF